MSTITAKDGSVPGRADFGHPSGAAAPRTSGATIHTLVAWLPWTNPARPATSIDEAQLVAELRAACGDQRRQYRRCDLTAVLNTLRGGMAFFEVQRQAPGLDAGRMLDAYLEIDRLRLESIAAWEAIAGNPTPAAVEGHGDAAARLLPVGIARLRQVIETDPQLLANAVADIDAGISDSQHLADRIELELDRTESRTEWAMKLGRQLYDPYGECVFGRSEFLAHRVGALMPQRVAELLRGVDDEPDAAEHGGLVA